MLTQIQRELADGWSLILGTEGGQLFTVSAVLILMGLLWEVWFGGRNLCLLSPKSLGELERTHPHIPSLAKVTLIILTFVQLYIVSLTALPGAIFGHDAREWVLLGTIFLFTMMAAIWAELRWHGVVQILYGIVTGTTAAFFLFLGKSTLSSYGSLTAVILIILLAIGGSALALMRGQGNRRMLLSLTLSMVFWILLHLLS